MTFFRLLGAALFFLAASHANAADRAPAFSWNGMYVGGHVGYGWSDFDDRISVAGISGEITSKPDGWLGGAQIGYNVQFAPHWLIGGEIDQTLADMSGTLRASGVPGTLGELNIRSFGSARTRFGYIADRTLFYVTGGMAWASLSDHDKYYGWTIGGGMEYALDPHWSVKLEYLFADFDGMQAHTSIINNFSIRESRDLTMNVVRAGINYRFGEPGAQPAYNLPAKASWPARDPWSGAYIGLHGGYGRARLSEADILPIPNASGYFGGFQTGYNWHFAPAWLLGVEADASFGDISGDIGVPGAIDKAEVDRIATARVRLGYVAGPSLWYVTGGVAAADLKWRISVPATFDLGIDTWNVGWTAGGGIEYAITPDWSVKAEYLYLGIRQQDLDWSAQTFKVGLNYHGPVLERLFTAR